MTPCERLRQRTVAAVNRSNSLSTLTKKPRSSDRGHFGQGLDEEPNEPSALVLDDAHVDANGPGAVWCYLDRHPARRFIHCSEEMVRHGNRSEDDSHELLGRPIRRLEARKVIAGLEGLLERIAREQQDDITISAVAHCHPASNGVEAIVLERAGKRRQSYPTHLPDGCIRFAEGLNGATVIGRDRCPQWNRFDGGRTGQVLNTSGSDKRRGNRANSSDSHWCRIKEKTNGSIHAPLPLTDERSTRGSRVAAYIDTGSRAMRSQTDDRNDAGIGQDNKN